MQIKTHHNKRQVTEHEFYILSKGYNSGKPLEIKCPNCFVCICKNDDEKQQLYWLFYGLWQGRYFQPFLTGTVIPFIRLNDVKQVAKIAKDKIELEPQQFTKNIETIQLLEKQNTIITEQISLIKEAKKALMYQILK